MGFPKNFIIPVSRTQMYRQFSNSVGRPVVEAIAKQMSKTIYLDTSVSLTRFTLIKL